MPNRPAFPLPPLITLADPHWDTWVVAHAKAHLLQLAAWGELKSRFGWRAQRVVLPDAAGQPAAAAQILLKRVLGLTVAYVPRGPVVDWQNEPLVAAMVDGLMAEARRLDAAVLKLEPELPDSPGNRALLTRLGFAPSRQTVQPPSTVMLDIGGSEETILTAMKSKWRYNVRLAAKKGVVVRAMTRSDLPAFFELMATTGDRDGFAVHSNEYYAAAFDLLAPHHAVFLLATYQEQPLAAIVVAAAGDTAYYLWGASSDRERNRMPNHGLQWAGMQWARSRGATRYDFWGIPDEIGQLAAGMRGGDGSGTPCDILPIDVEKLPQEGLWGVYRFKQGFGGDAVRLVGTWDRPVQPVGFQLYQTGLALNRLRSEWRVQKEAVASGMTRSADSHRQEKALRTIVDPAEWRRVLAALPAPHVLQSWEWGQVKAQTGWQATRCQLTAPVGQAAFQFLWRQPLGLLPVRVGYLPKGPVVDWQNPVLVEATLDAIQQLARQRGCLFVKIDPDVVEDSPAGERLLASLQQRGWRYSGEQVQFKNTGISDLAGGEETLLAGMKQKWRYNVRLAEKRGITVRIGNETDLHAFYDLYAETGRRDGFLIRPPAYYLETWRTFLQAQREADNPAGGALLLAEHADESGPLAGLFLFRYGRQAWYFYGASSERRRRDMPNYLLQWEALRWALAQGCTCYDWWGAPTRPEDEADAMQGVWQFKQGFGAQLSRHIGAWDYPVTTLGYRAFTEILPQALALAGRWQRAGVAGSSTGTPHQAA